MEQLRKRAQNLQAELKNATERLKLPESVKELGELEAQMAKPEFWHDSAQAQQISKHQAELQRRVGPWQKMQKAADELAEMSAMADASMADELTAQLDGLEKQFTELK